MASKTVGSLWVTIKSAGGLRKADHLLGHGLLAGSSDPFCVCEIEGRKDQRFQTPTVFDSTSPVWNHEHTFTEYRVGDGLIFTVYDKDIGPSSDHLGKATVKASQFEDGFEGSVVLKETEDAPATLDLRILPLKAMRPASKFTLFNRRWWSQENNHDYEAISAPLNADSQQKRQTLKVSIASCPGLRSGDWLPGEGANSGSSDPYCTCEIVGKPDSRIKTPVVQDSNDPVWDFQGELPDYAPGETLLFAVFDQDWGKADDFLGASELPAMHFDPVAFDGDITLSDAGPGVRPQLRVRVELADFEETLGVNTATGLGIRRKLWGTWSKYANIKVTQDMGYTPSLTGMHLRQELRNTPEKIAKAIAKKKRDAKLALIDLVWSRREAVLTATRDTIKEAIIADPDMCMCLRRWLAKLINQIWCDVVTEVEIMVEATRVGVAGHSMEDVESLARKGHEPPFLCHPRALRGLLLYRLLPYDKSFFGQLKDPVYFVYLAVAFVPVLRNFMYALVLFLITLPGPPDEYQLVQFIMAFKSTQFLSGGIFLATTGTWGYYWCVGQAEHHTCRTYGPGESSIFGGIYGDLGVVDVVGSSVLVWIAFLLLPYSEQNAGLRKTELHEDQMATDDFTACWQGRSWNRFQYEGRGGRIGGLLRYDLGCFLLSILMLLVLEIMRYHEDPKVFLDPEVGHLLHSWKFRETLFVVRVFYGWAALPFFVFNLPILRQILTHTVPTGFNRRGACVAYLLRPVAPLDEEDPVEEEKLEQEARDQSASGGEQRQRQ